MKERWKYGKYGFAGYFCLTGWLLLVSSCNMDQVKAPPSNKISFKLDELVLPVNQAVLSNIKTVSATENTVGPVIKSFGVISYDPRLVNNISARYGGRIEKLYVKFNFEEISKGQRIMDIYSPDIVTEQQNLIFLVSSPSPDKALISSSEQKLKLLGMSDEQLKQVEITQKFINPLPLYSDYSGHIHDIGITKGVTSMPPSSMNNNMSSMNNQQAAGQTQIENIPSSQTAALSIKEGMYVESGQAMFAIYNTSELWAVLNIYPKDAPLIKVGDSVSMAAETNPEHLIPATVGYIEPVLETNSATVKVRVYLKNEEHYHFRIGALLSANVFPHKVKGLWLPNNAVVDLGTEKVVFLQKGNYFMVTKIETGIVTDSLIQITKGLSVDDKVASNAQYLVDSESFIKSGSDE